MGFCSEKLQTFIYLLFIYILLRYDCHITLYKFRVKKYWFDTFIYCNMIATVALTPLLYHIIIIYFFVMRTIKLYSLGNFEFYNTISLSMITMLRTRPP